MNQIPAGPPPAKPSVIETAQDFFAWLDEAVEAEERAEEKYPASIGIYCDRCGVTAERDYVVSDRMDRQQRFAAARRHLTANEGWKCDSSGDLCPRHAAGAQEEQSS